ncbi:MPPED1 [Acrasis kona]|uniref:MPPED1 n=1 Tax=Acrasis kona TaxID=1008807 RepID=A0AAW2YV36_9EUKA
MNNELTVNTSKKPNQSFRIVCLSDTHNKHDEITEFYSEMMYGSVLLHAGDFTNRGTLEEIESFNGFIQSIKHKFTYVVIIAGNHDIMMDRTINKNLLLNADNKHPLLENCIYLQDSFVDLDIEGSKIRIYGTPYSASRPAFYMNQTKDRSIKWRTIPNDTDILVTHSPPIGIMDLITPRKPKNDSDSTELPQQPKNTEVPQKISKNCSICKQQHVGYGHGGSRSLWKEVIGRVKPSIHLFGHIHSGYGHQLLQYDDGSSTLFINSAMCHDDKTETIRGPVIINYCC